MENQNDKYNVRNFRCFLFGMSPNILAFKVLLLQVTLSLNLILMNNCSRHSYSNFANSFDSLCKQKVELECLLLTFIYFNSNSKSRAKTKTDGTLKLILEKEKIVIEFKHDV